MGREQLCWGLPRQTQASASLMPGASCPLRTPFSWGLPSLQGREAGSSLRGCWAWRLWGHDCRRPDPQGPATKGGPWPSQRLVLGTAPRGQQLGRWVQLDHPSHLLCSSCQASGLQTSEHPGRPRGSAWEPRRGEVCRQTEGQGSGGRVEGRAGVRLAEL